MIKTITGIRDGFHFLDPVFLYLLIPLAVLLVMWTGVTIVKLVKRPTQTYGSNYPLVGKIKLWGLFVLPAGVLMVLAMAKPTLSKGSFKASRGDIEVAVVIDRSISMRADDLRPMRLDIAKREAFGLESFLRDGDKTALFVFGKESHRKAYLSGRFENTFGQLDRIYFSEKLTNDAIVWDSDFASMLENIYQSFDRQDAFSEGYLGKKYIPKKRTNRIVIIFSDGEDQLKKVKPTTPEEAKDKDEYTKRLSRTLMEFRKRGLKIYPVGIGTERGVSWLSLLRGYKKQEEYEEGYFSPGDYPAYLVQYWQNKVSRIDKNNLVFLARSTGVQLNNKIWTVENSSTTVRSYLDSIISSNRRSVIEFGQSENDQDLWQDFLIAAVGILVVGMLTYPVSGYLRRRRN